MTKTNYSSKYLKWLFVCFIFATGCTSNQFESALTEDKQKQLDTDPIENCEAPVSKYKLSTDIVSLKIKSETNVTFGFDLLKKWFKFFGATFKTKSGELRLEMNITDSLNEQKLLAHGGGISIMNKREFSFQFGIDEFGMTFENFFETPLAELTSRSLDNALGDLKENFDSNTEEWSTNVQAVIPDYNEIIISAGKSSRLQQGDVLAFYNTEHIWSGAPCRSNYISSRRTSVKPLAFGTVLFVKNHTAQLEITPALGATEKIKVGAEGVVQTLTENNRVLRQSIVVSNIKNSSLIFENDSIDLSPYLSKQIHRIAAEKGFVVYKEKIKIALHQ